MRQVMTGPWLTMVLAWSSVGQAIDMFLEKCLQNIWHLTFGIWLNLKQIKPHCLSAKWGVGI